MPPQFEQLLFYVEASAGLEKIDHQVAGKKQSCTAPNGAVIFYSETSDGSLHVDFRANGDLFVSKYADGRYYARVPGYGKAEEHSKLKILALLAVLRSILPKAENIERQARELKKTVKDALVGNRCAESGKNRNDKRLRLADTFPKPRAVKTPKLPEHLVERGTLGSEAPCFWAAEAVFNRIQNSDEIVSKGNAILAYIAYARISNETRSQSFVAHRVHVEARACLGQTAVKSANRDLVRIGVLHISRNHLTGTDAHAVSTYTLVATRPTPGPQQTDTLDVVNGRAGSQSVPLIKEEASKKTEEESAQLSDDDWLKK
jgi:hypothetical protein